MTVEQIVKQIKAKKSFLSVGLDTDIDKIPQHIRKGSDPVFEFNKAIIDSTKDFTVAYSINTAFYEALGQKGWDSLEKTLKYIPKDIFKIADAKCGDIGNSSAKYAEAYFKRLNFDAITVSPYMGREAVQPFLEYKGKWVIVMALTSNESSKDFQLMKVGKNYLFEEVAKKVVSWGSPENTMLVIGATHPKMFKSMRKIAPKHFLMVPGLGTQGGDISTFAKDSITKDCGLLVHASRSVIYADKGKNFSVKAMKSAFQYQREMEIVLQDKKII